MHNPKQPEHFLTIRTLSVYRVRPWETAVLEPILSALSVPWSFLLQISFGDKILTYFLLCLWQQDHLETTYWVLCKKQMETLLQQSWVLCWPCRQMGLVGECGILGCYRTPVQTFVFVWDFLWHKNCFLMIVCYKYAISRGTGEISINRFLGTWSVQSGGLEHHTK